MHTFEGKTLFIQCYVASMLLAIGRKAVVKRHKIEIKYLKTPVNAGSGMFLLEFKELFNH